MKTQLADKAVQAAKAAAVALAGKQAIVGQLQQEMKEAESVVAEESSSLQRVQANANVAVEAAKQAQQQVKVISRR